MAISRLGNTTRIIYQLTNTTFEIAANTLNTTLELANKINETCANGALDRIKEQPCKGSDVIAMVSDCTNPQDRKEAVITFCDNIGTFVNFTEECIAQAFHDYEQDQHCTTWLPLLVGGALFLTAAAGVAAFHYFGPKNKSTFYTSVNSDSSEYEYDVHPDASEAFGSYLSPGHD